MENIVYKARIVVPIREMDNQFTQIQDLIDAKRQLLIDKQKKLRFISKQNQFLDAVKSDYTKYYMYISEQKRDQMKALQVLDQYIKDLTISGKLTKHNIEDAKEEQYKILKELKMIKGSLDDLVDDSQYIDNTLKNKSI
jgi:cell division septum initiation protein DivIVA